MMQRVCRVRGGVKTYVSNPRCLLTGEERVCPWCPQQHRLRLHGVYWRYAILARPEPVERIPVVRLLCPRQNRTVSLLPEFCLPRRQYGPAVLGLFLEGLVLDGLGLVAAVERARGACPGHAVGQQLRDGFRRRRRAIEAYLAGLRRRVEPDELEPTRRYGELAVLVRQLLKGFDHPATAFVHHGRLVHAAFHVGLA